MTADKLFEIDHTSFSTGAKNWLGRQRDEWMGTPDAMARHNVRLAANKIYAAWRMYLVQSPQQLSGTGADLANFITRYYGDDKVGKLINLVPGARKILPRQRKTAAAPTTAPAPAGTTPAAAPAPVGTNQQAAPPPGGATQQAVQPGGTQPTGTWRPVRPGELFPPGKSFRLNVATGEQEVLEGRRMVEAPQPPAPAPGTPAPAQTPAQTAPRTRRTPVPVTRAQADAIFVALARIMLDSGEAGPVQRGQGGGAQGGGTQGGGTQGGVQAGGGGRSFERLVTVKITPAGMKTGKDRAFRDGIQFNSTQADTITQMIDQSPSTIRELMNTPVGKNVSGNTMLMLLIAAEHS